ncbi:hypothetical protein SAMN05216371_0192 [Streptomyces sp. TLI_053]|uniref:DUF6461 domain-containing protein n=1 Tax=Streptomyces sp. TLI_053 TaxID=1855352 RepID=UPI0008797C9F|nr:DUF6461 domain-containing protein [Streptomyces sp. TLI_053]SDS57615.1 hypothetical protein SAMN05216371_0192 [Streptomyces sp. TLI_053]
MSDHTHDHSWFRTHYPSLQDAYCLTLVEGVPAGELLRRAGALSGPWVTGIDAVCEAAENLEAETGGERMLVAVADLADGWTLVLEPNGYLGVHEETIAAWADTTLVSHFRNVNASTRFCWYANGTARLRTEDMAPGTVSAAVPDFDPAPYPDRTELALALAEHLTGVHLTPELLEGTPFATGTVDEPWN